jgi:4-hydroxymandelate oxidase
VVKGVLRADDARRCAQAGARAVWVSNHGGRQLDRTVTTAFALPEIAAALDGAAEVYVDGGVRSGLDVVAALALGADAVFLGRQPVWALVEGEPGVARLHAELREEVTEAFRLAGCRSVSDTRGIAAPPARP